MTPALSQELDRYLAEREALTARLAEVNAHIAALEEQAVREARADTLQDLVEQMFRWPGYRK